MLPPAVEPAVVWLIDPSEGDSWALTGAYDNLRWLALAEHLAGSGFDVVSLDRGPLDVPPEPRAVVVNGLNRTAPQAMDLIHQARARFPLTPIYVTGRAGYEIAGTAVDYAVQHASEDQLAVGLGPDGRLHGLRPSMHWWRAMTPTRPGGPKLPLGVLEVEATRGCTHHCTFCSVFVSTGRPGRAWQPRPPADIATEIAHWHAENGVDRVQFVDDNFLGSPTDAPRWADELATELLWRSPEISFSIYARLDTTLLKSLTSLRAAGLVQVHAGIESASNAVLRRLAKGVTIEEMDRVKDALTALGVELVPSFIVFEARSTPKEVLTTLDWIEGNNLLAWFTPSTALLFAGTPLTRQLATDTGPQFLSPDGAIAPVRVPFTNPIVAEAYRVAVDLDADTDRSRVPDLDAMMRQRMVRDGDLFCRPIGSDPLLADLERYRRAQVARVRQILEAAR